jgi:hypothetical protein
MVGCQPTLQLLPGEKMDRIRLVYRYGILVLIFCCISGCRNQIDIGDGGFISDVPCGPPCFWNIIPGQTREEEAIRILVEKNVYQYCEEINNEYEGGSRGLTCKNDIFLHYTRGSDIVNGISINPSNKIIIGDVIEKYGDPDYITVYTGTLISSTTKFTEMRLHYFKINTTLYLPGIKNDLYEINDNTEIEYIGYSGIDSMEQKINQPLQKWHGYGTYNQLH